MALRAKVVRKKVEKVEKKGFQSYTLDHQGLPVLDELLHDVYAMGRPKGSDYRVRRDLIVVFNEIAKEIYGNANPVVEEFGSFSMDLFNSQSDLDLSINFGYTAVANTREKKIRTLRKFAKKLYALQREGHVYGVHPITRARVPIVKVVDRGTGVECDISVENRDGILKSQILHMISSIDERFQKLGFLMKTWAKSQKINSSREGTLNSLSIILLVSFHLQTRTPPILPPFSAIFRDGTDPATVKKLLPDFLNYGRSNKESLAELFITLLLKLSSVEKLWAKGLCASTYEGSWTSKTWDSKVGCISVEDFSDRCENVARAVGPEEVKQIYKCIHLSTRHVFAFLNGKIERWKFLGLLFGMDPVPSRNPFRNTVRCTIPTACIQTKEEQLVKDCRKNQQVIPVEPVPTHGKSCTGDQGRVALGSVLQSQQVVGSGAAAVKRMRLAEGWAGVVTQVPGRPGEGRHTEGWRGMAGSWGGAQQPVMEGWSMVQQGTEGWRHAECWQGTQQPSASSWGEQCAVFFNPMQTRDGICRSFVGNGLG